MMHALPDPQQEKKQSIVPQQALLMASGGLTLVATLSITLHQECLGNQINDAQEDSLRRFRL